MKVLTQYDIKKGKIITYATDYNNLITKNTIEVI